MGDRWLGVTVSGDKVTMVDIEVVDDETFIVHRDTTIRVSTGDRPSALRDVHNQVCDYVENNQIAFAAVKGSALSQAGKPKLGMLLTAELRGVVICALAERCTVKVPTKANISRNYGERKVDEYVADDDFWDEKITGAEVRNGSREAAFCVIASVEQ